MKMFKIESHTIKGKYYVVRLTDEGWKCNCPAFLLHEREIIVCKHIIDVINAQKNNGRS